jgi:DNA replication protein DnaC
LAIASLRRFVERTEGEDPASFWNVNHSLQTIRQSFDEDRRQEGSSILDVCRASFIVLDDFDKVGRVTAWVEEQFYALINGLYVEERRVIVTTNLSARRLLEMLDDSLASRLMEMCTEVAMAPHDYRAAS